MAMRKDVFLLIVGLLVFVVPFLGIPEAWKDIMLFVLGGFVVIGAFVCRLSSRMENINEEDVIYEESMPVNNNGSEEI